MYSYLQEDLLPVTSLTQPKETEPRPDMQPTPTTHVRHGTGQPTRATALDVDAVTHIPWRERMLGDGSRTTTDGVFAPLVAQGDPNVPLPLNRHNGLGAHHRQQPRAEVHFQAKQTVHPTSHAEQLAIMRAVFADRDALRRAHVR